ncbi:hypothetical protein DV20_22215 [Amycolatopsis rifamycinica]|uniref:Uncharacterized protein n=1 Tax=Amycolatopsis rifamycinica TaxID=287986 RepID=A0A066U6T2_9PSEU|nr:hypothetical protein DV20_22215 [Amycolatopsis rifamycinica]
MSKTLEMHGDTPWVDPASEMMVRRSFFPVFDDDEVIRCIGQLAGEYPEAARRTDRRSLGLHRSTTGPNGVVLVAVTPVATLVFAGVSAFSAWVVLRSLPETLRRTGGSWFEVGFVLTVLGSMFVASLALAASRHPDLRFQRVVAKVQRLTREGFAPMYRIVRCANLAGKAARELFRVHQGRRLTWVSPPMVADRALTLSFPLVDVELSREANPDDLDKVIRVYGEFLYFAAALEAAGRPELIPKLRDHYARSGLLERRNAEPPGEVPERDALFLDPMRNHSRWAVAKDFLYPLSSWFSLAVAVAALVVSLAR